MDRQKLADLLDAYKSEDIDLDEVIQKLSLYPLQEGGFAQVDVHRELRRGFPETIFCPGKTPEQVGRIAKRILTSSDRMLATRADRAHYESVLAVADDAQWSEAGRTIIVDRRQAKPKGLVAVVSAGTSDIPVAEEARITCEILGNRVKTFYDVGVAGLHRIIAQLEELRKARVIIVVAGMEGALASVVGGFSAVPVIAVPTSIGYGASFGGLAALLSMLNTCAAGVTVVNIDNGFGAAYTASLINQNPVALDTDED